MILTAAYFILALLLLVLFHELGHFLVARLCGVKVLAFSFGFGRVLASWRDKRGTEYVWSLWPLGGYVKMLDESEGDVLPEERHLAFNNQSLLVRTAIVLAGPVFNFLFAFAALWLVLVIGVHALAPIIEDVKPGSLAAVAGLQSKEEIISLNNKPVASWRDVQYMLIPLIGSDETIRIQTKSMPNGELKTVLLPLAEWRLDAKKPDPLLSLGLVPFIPAVPPVVGEVIENSPASAAGFALGDRIQSMNTTPLADWMDLVEYVAAHPGAPLKLSVLRKGKIQTVSLIIGSRKEGGETSGFLGLRSQKVDWPKQWLRFQHEGPVEALGTAAKQTIALTGATFSLIGRFISGKISLQNLSGPVGIAQGAGESGRSGLIAYLSFLALISISLGVLNLLPIPMLDGGHLLFFFIEFLIRRPLPERFKLVTLYLGLAFLVAITILAFSNDIARLRG